MSIEVKKKDQEPMFKVANAPVVKSFAAFESAIVKQPKKKDTIKTTPKFLTELFRVAMLHDKVTGCVRHANAKVACIEFTCSKYLGINAGHTHEEVIEMIKERGIQMVPDYYSLKCGPCKTKNAPYKFSGQLNFMYHMIDNHQDTYTLATIMEMIHTLEQNSVTPGRQIDIKLDSQGRPITAEHAQDD